MPSDRLGDSNIKKTLPETIGVFLEAPSEKLLESIKLKTFNYNQLNDLLVKLSNIYKNNSILQKLFLKCLTRIAKLSIQRGNYDKAEAHLNKTLEIEPNNVVAKYELIQTLILNEKKNKAESIVYDLIQTLPAHSQLKFLVLCAFYTLHPKHDLWPVLEQNTGIKKTQVANVAKDYKQVSLLMLNYYQNSIWRRSYSSLPVNVMASHGVSDPLELRKDQRPKNKKNVKHGPVIHKKLPK